VSTTFLSTLSRSTRESLAELGIATDETLQRASIPDLLTAGVSWGQTHKIINYLVENGLPVAFQKPDETWDEERWRDLIAAIVDDGVLSWEEVAVAVLGELNPPQVGTSQASNDNIKQLYEPRKAMRAVMEWFYAQDGKCVNCGRRIHLEVDHIVGKDEFIRVGKDPAEADTLDNLQLLCRRCNVIKRASHKLGGLSFATAQAALMWILLAERPRTREQFDRLCRAHGLTMANIRFEEAWAMAIWLAKAGKYELDETIEESVEEAVEEAVQSSAESMMDEETRPS
jgi:hypothetical protein